jgi:hypothetical protein
MKFIIEIASAAFVGFWLGYLLGCYWFPAKSKYDVYLDRLNYCDRSKC